MKIENMKFKDCFNFGKYKGDLLENVMAKDIGYVTWCLKEGIVSLDKEESKIYDTLAFRASI